MPKRKPKGIVVKTTKFRKGGLVIHSSSYKTISNEARAKHGTLEFTEMQIGRSRFIPLVRGDKRIEIPLRIVKKEKLKSGNLHVNIVRVKGGTSKKERRIFGKKKYGIARDSAKIESNYYVVPIEEVNLQNLKAEIFRDIYRMRNQGKHFYFRLNFLLIPEKTSAYDSPFAFSKTFPEDISDDISRHPTLIAKQIDKFVDDTFAEMVGILMSRSSPTEQIFFVDYAISFINVYSTGLAHKGRNI
jgi:hypothetical protein